MPRVYLAGHQFYSFPAAGICLTFCLSVLFCWRIHDEKFIQEEEGATFTTRACRNSTHEPLFRKILHLAFLPRQLIYVGGMS